LKRIGLISLIAVMLLSASLSSAGPIDSPLPNNPCAPPIGDLKLALVANGVGTDNGGPACGAVGSGCAETRIVCTHVGAGDDDSVDIGVEFFDNSGNIVPGSFIDNNSVECGLVPGASVAFATVGVLDLPYFGFPTVTAGPVVPLGSMRVLSSSPKLVACDVTLIDVANVADAGVPTNIHDVTVTKSNKGQKGD
jgi:hypothetical protein